MSGKNGLKSNTSLESEEKYISLSQASEFSCYSQEYLSLRARQGKLKACKNGRNWVTTREWVREYEEKFKADSPKKVFTFKKMFILAILGIILLAGFFVIATRVLAYDKNIELRKSEREHPKLEIKAASVNKSLGNFWEESYFHFAEEMVEISYRLGNKIGMIENFFFLGSKKISRNGLRVAGLMGEALGKKYFNLAEHISVASFSISSHFGEFLGKNTLGLTCGMVKICNNFGRVLDSSEKSLMTAGKLAGLTTGQEIATLREKINLFSKKMPQNIDEFNLLVEKGNKTKTASITVDHIKSFPPGRVAGAAVRKEYSEPKFFLGISGIFDGARIIIDCSDKTMGSLISGMGKGMAIVVGGLESTMRYVFKDNNKINNIEKEKNPIPVGTRALEKEKNVMEKVNTKKLCIEEVCLDRDQLKSLLESQNILKQSHDPLLENDFKEQEKRSLEIISTSTPLRQEDE